METDLSKSGDVQPAFPVAGGSTVFLRCYWRDYRTNVLITAPLVLGVLAITYHVEGKGIAILAGAMLGLWLGAVHNLAWALAQRRVDQSNNQGEGRRK